MLFDDPEMPNQGLAIEQQQHLACQTPKRRDRLNAGPHNNQTPMLIRRVRPRIGKIEVQGNKRPLLGLANTSYIDVRMPSHPLFEHGCCIMSALAQHRSDF